MNYKLVNIRRASWTSGSRKIDLIEFLIENRSRTLRLRDTVCCQYDGDTGDNSQEQTIHINNTKKSCLTNTAILIPFVTILRAEGVMSNRERARTEYQISLVDR